MFKRFFNNIQESFTGYSAQTDPNSIGTNNIKKYYSETLPNAIYGQDPSIPLAEMTKTLNNAQTNTMSILNNSWAATGGLSTDILSSRRAACQGTGGDTFDHLVSLAANFDPKSQLRCGWVYNNANPSSGAGAYGSADGPYDTSAVGTWMWDLNAAKQKYHTALCNQITSCQDLDSPMYKGRCGWCTTSGKAVPIVNGAVAYPYGTTTGCSASSLIKSSGACPSAAAPPGVSGIPASQGDICTPLANGHLSRTCLTSKLTQVGCTNNGTIFQALQSGSDTSYLDTLEPNLAYKIYQSRAIVPLDSTAINTGNLTVAQALNEFTRINDQASSNLISGLNYAARDLCYKSGTMDTFDFCTEILDSTYSPFTIECLQKEFLRAGGQKTGTMYPSTSNLKTWNSNNNWAAVKNIIKKLAADTQSTNRLTQQNAIKQFYGISLEDKSQPLFSPVPGVEIFWFTHKFDDISTANNIFLGRRIRPTIPVINQSNDLQGVNNVTNVAMVYFTNLAVTSNQKSLCAITADDGFALQLNSPLGPGYKNGLRNSTANSLVALDYFPPTTFNTQFSLRATGSNVLSGFFFQGYGGLYYQLELEQGGVMKVIPASMLTLTQEPFAPMFSFQVYQNPQLFGGDFNFADSRMGSFKIKWTTQTGTPVWAYGSEPGRTHPFDLPIVRFNSGSSIQTIGSFKMYSFMAISILITFNALPANAVTMQEYFYMTGALGRIGIRVTGTGTYGEADLHLSAEGAQPPSTSMIKVTQGVPYLLVLNVIRTNIADIYSVSGLKLLAQKLSVLQNDPNSMVTSPQLSFSNPSTFSNPDTMESRVIGVGNGDIDISWIRIYDYNLDSTSIARELKDDWQHLLNY
jgi:hypothetical protein